MIGSNFYIVYRMRRSILNNPPTPPPIVSVQLSDITKPTAPVANEEPYQTVFPSEPVPTEPTFPNDSKNPIESLGFIMAPNEKCNPLTVTTGEPDKSIFPELNLY